ncbi:hypothetical protein ACFQAT_10660 [Undibacterium arcticum]|uniref:hypothetical protein n=1 Tax=Undibacterium arcticum TaxID=1762892 RepID=UPI00360CFC86
MSNHDIGYAIWSLRMVFGTDITSTELPACLIRAHYAVANDACTGGCLEVALKIQTSV